jgi:hypothetical protein
MIGTKTPSKAASLLDELKARGLPIPAALEESLPLALTTRADLPVWAAAHGYDAAALVVLNRAIAKTVHGHVYQRALGMDLSERHTLDGAPVEQVSGPDRLTAALNLHRQALHDLTLAQRKNEPASEPKKVESGVEPIPELKKTAPVPVASKRPTIRLGALSPQEIERRRAALAEAVR